MTPRYPITRRHIPLYLAGDRPDTSEPEAPQPIEDPALVSETNPYGTRRVRAILEQIAGGAVQIELEDAALGRVAGRPHSGGRVREPRGLCLHCGRQVAESSRYPRACTERCRMEIAKGIAPRRGVAFGAAS